jgi:cyclopropane-fatty-acyl-phospholipid synthase
VTSTSRITGGQDWEKWEERGAAPSGPGASAGAIQFHYDIGTDFYRLWLDPSLTYSSAMWEDIDGDESETSVLAAGQRAKLVYHLDQANVADGAHLLDVGCGWGSLVSLAERDGRVGRSVGLTLSQDQAGYIGGMGLADTEVRLESWRDHHPMTAYDAVVAIGSFEHFAHRGLSPKERVLAYTEFFAKCYSWLPERGRLSLQTIALDDEMESAGPIAEFYDSEVFPSSTPPRLSEIAWACDSYFSVSKLRNDGDDYERTLHAWSLRLQRSRDKATQITSPETYRKYLRYLRVSQAMFKRRTCTLYRITLERRPRRLPLVLL